jgi:glycosyltransferase involved in cell wall biosynthesis
LDDFIQLADMLSEDFAIVLVGLSPKQLKELPEQILGITRTESQRELAEIYTAADVFFCSSREENYPTVHLEAQACGTPVITYDAGGSSETLCLTKSVSLPVEDIKQACEQIKVLQNTTKGCLTLNTGANV